MIQYIRFFILILINRILKVYQYLYLSLGLGFNWEVPIDSTVI